MAHRQKVEEASQRRGRKISPELIEQLLGFAGPAAIKSITGLPNIGVRLAGKQLVKKETLSGLKDLVNPDRLSKSSRAAVRNRANIDRPSTIAGGERRANVGGRRPPDTELEALALKKQVGQTRVRQEKALRKEGLTLKTRVNEIVSELDLLRKQGLGAKESRRALVLQEELRRITARFFEKE